MPDDKTVITNGQADPTKPLIEEVRTKSFTQILKEQSEARQKATAGEEEVTTESKPTEEEEKAAKEAEEAKAKVEEEEAARKRDEEIARKASEETLAKQKEEAEQKAKEEEEKKKQEEAAKAREEELKPRFTGKDKDGNVVPASYEELVSESARIGKLMGKEETLAEIEARNKAQEAEAEKAKKAEEERKAKGKAFEEQLQKEIDDDLKAIYAAGDLPKVKDPKDENDLGNKEFKHLFETAQTVNMDRIKRGLPIIRSLQTIRYGKDETGKPYYTPLSATPAGHDAPVLGSESTVSKTLPEDKYIPARDRNKSMTQLLQEEAKRLGRKLNVRGK